MPSFMIDSHQGGDAQSGVVDGCSGTADAGTARNGYVEPRLLDRG